MTIPDFQTVMRPILERLSDGRTVATKDLIAAIADEFNLSEDERAQTLASGQRTIYNRVHWAFTHLSQAGLLERPVRAHLKITDAGRRVLVEHPTRVDMTVLRTFPSYLEFRERTRAKKSETTESKDVPDEVEAEISPQDLVEQALAENQAAVEGDVLKRALALDPAGFERLVLRLLKDMGYGRDGTLEHSGRSGDAGIDGIISQDPLGLDRIYLQVKRYDPSQKIMSPTIREFVGSLMNAQGDRGVFITTSTFSSGAEDVADRVNARIELIDGPRLATLMVRHGVGVKPETTIVLHEVDEDFFESL